MKKELSPIERMRLMVQLWNNPSVKQLSVNGRRQLMKIIGFHKFRKNDDRVVFQSILPPFPSPAFDGMVNNLINTVFATPSPTVAHIALTDACPYNCWHCSNRGKEGILLNHEEKLKLVEDLAEAGIGIFAFTGGEPMLEKHLDEYIRTAASYGAFTALFTTGYGMDEERAFELKEAGLYYPTISLDYFQPEEHDRMRGYKGAFDIAVAAVKNCVKAGMYTILEPVLTEELLLGGNLWKYLDFAAELGVDEIRLLEQLPSGEIVGSCMEVSGTDTEKILDIMYKSAKKSKYPTFVYYPHFESRQLAGCTAGQQFIYVDAYGNLCPCDFVPLSFGNVLEEPLDTILSRISQTLDKPSGKCLSKKVNEHLLEYIKTEDSALPVEPLETLRICNLCKESEFLPIYKKIHSTNSQFGREAMLIEERKVNVDRKRTSIKEMRGIS